MYTRSAHCQRTPALVRSILVPRHFMSNEGKREAGLSALGRGKYISLATFRKTGEAVYTPLWFAEQDGKLYVMTRNDSWKYKRIRNNPNVRVAPSTIRGRIIGPELPARARVLSGDESMLPIAFSSASIS